jgi:hemerythrin-like metal-binding protein
VIDFEIARAWHKLFALHVEFVIEGIEKTSLDPQTVRDDAVCDLGKWIFGSGARYARTPEYADLVETHIRFHFAAGAILNDHLAGNTASQSAKFCAASEAFLAAIDALVSGAVTDQESGEMAAVAKKMGNSGEPVWKESMRIGMKLIDEQHEALLRWIEKLNVQPMAAIASRNFVDSLSAVKRLEMLHFETEEMFMQRIGFRPDQLVEHVDDHGRLLAQLVKVEFDVNSGVRKAAAEAYRTIKGEVLRHIAKYDMSLSKFAVD